MSPEKMCRMANQIARFFHSQNEPDRAGRVADHLSDFWDPSMRQMLIAHIDAGGGDLDPLVIEAAERLR
ncbi:MAG: formate dehydrogenase subunit delta [Paracoccus sp. (in: a-proteobacteria)]|nr:formate dehydrogenase subunit delta [Paracoccus sp. (in: a-proteobacteria)]